MTSSEHARQAFQALILSNVSDEDFIDKIRPYRGDLAEIFNKPSIGLSEGVLLLKGFFPGPWLDQVPNNLDAYEKLKNEWVIYQSIKEAIRGNKIGARLEGSTYFLRPYDLVLWFWENNIGIHHSVEGFLIPQRGRPLDGPEIIAEITTYFHKNGFQAITITHLKKKEHQAIHNLVDEYLAIAEIKPGSKNESATRRLKTLRYNVNKALKKQPPS
ncbi:MAG TPA: hypothetical protein VLE95_08020 [Chlamydiales bacterium]|nr:hypothetical protein [Chlamydiales bacterium]